MAEIRFQFDEHIPHAVALALRRRAIDVATSVEAGLIGASDEEQSAGAHDEGWVLVTHDDDSLALHQQGWRHSGIVYCHQHARTIGQIIASLVLIYEALEPEEMVGQVEYL